MRIENILPAIKVMAGFAGPTATMIGRRQGIRMTGSTSHADDNLVIKVLELLGFQISHARLLHLAVLKWQNDKGQQ